VEGDMASLSAELSRLAAQADDLRRANSALEAANMEERRRVEFIEARAEAMRMDESRIVEDKLQNLQLRLAAEVQAEASRSAQRERELRRELEAQYASEIAEISEREQLLRGELQQQLAKGACAESMVKVQAQACFAEAEKSVASERELRMELQQKLAIEACAESMVKVQAQACFAEAEKSVASERELRMELQQKLAIEACAESMVKVQAQACFAEAEKSVASERELRMELQQKLAVEAALRAEHNERTEFRAEERLRLERQLLDALLEVSHPENGLKAQLEAFAARLAQYEPSSAGSPAELEERRGLAQELLGRIEGLRARCTARKEVAVVVQAPATPPAPRRASVRRAHTDPAAKPSLGALALAGSASVARLAAALQEPSAEESGPQDPEYRSKLTSQLLTFASQLRQMYPYHEGEDAVTLTHAQTADALDFAAQDVPERLAQLEEELAQARAEASEARANLLLILGHMRQFLHNRCMSFQADLNTRQEVEVGMAAVMDMLQDSLAQASAKESGPSRALEGGVSIGDCLIRRLSEVLDSDEGDAVAAGGPHSDPEEAAEGVADRLASLLSPKRAGGSKEGGCFAAPADDLDTNEALPSHIGDPSHKAYAKDVFEETLDLRAARGMHGGAIDGDSDITPRRQAAGSYDRGGWESEETIANLLSSSGLSGATAHSFPPIPGCWSSGDRDAERAGLSMRT